jgi:hypothetical protein
MTKKPIQVRLLANRLWLVAMRDAATELISTEQVREALSLAAEQHEENLEFYNDPKIISKRERSAA